jgi:hypothetical protein
MEFRRPQVGDKLLDTEFSEIVMRGHMVGELDYLFQAVRSHTPHKNVSFSIEMETENPRPVWGPDRTFEEIEKYNALVHIRLQNVTLRQVLDTMTSQAGWDYYIAPQEVIFIAGRNVTRKPHMQSSWAGERKKTGSGSKIQDPATDE